jgi:hypothetical protein
MNDNEAILSYPFSGALYAFLCASQGANYLTNAQSPYYRTLFGKGYQRMADIAITLSILYDRIVMPRVDIPLPDYETHEVGGIYHHEDLGITCYNMRATKDFPDYAETSQIAIRDLEDSVVQKALIKIPPHAKVQILREAHEEIRIALMTQRRVICSTRRRRLILRLLELDYSNASLLVGGEAATRAIQIYRGITGLTFSPNSLDDYHYIKADEGVRSYSRQFTSILHSFNEEASPRDQLLTAMRTAMNTATCAKKASGIFSCSSSALGVAGLIPVVGSITGAMGIGTDALTRGADLIAYKNEWYQLAARVVEKKTELQIQEFIKSGRSST